ncbi:MAG: TfoX/Sxy family protein [Alphaproteobacteria bacterium]|jgi:DNA transformation protein|nr:TfoX/Sxy family protein [Candidatus Jidaibacter sp.]
MSTSDGFIEYLLDQMSEIDGIRSRKMFGGYGIYKHSIIFGIVVDEVFYIKGHDQNIALIKSLNSQPFSYTNKNGKLVSMRYWAVPVDTLEDREQLLSLIEQSV